jgi:ectoine hydroxylase-related dioxygenase (phytanoyl-CoA dioxygenase family)
MFDKEKFVYEINTQGYSIVENALSPDYIERAKVELMNAIEKEVAYHGGSTVYRDYGMVLLCSLYEGAFIELFDNPNITEPFNSILGDGSIVYAYTSSSMPPFKNNLSNRIHVDCPRLIPDYITNIGATILLDDFTEDNGATYFVPNSQNTADQPSEEEFYSKAIRLIAKAGTVWFFNARVWHAGGNNHTGNWRHALTINACRSYMKQRIDIPRAMAHLDTRKYSTNTLQKLGFWTQVPANYDEYYAPAELRKFKQKAE